MKLAFIMWGMAALCLYSCNTEVARETNAGNAGKDLHTLSDAGTMIVSHLDLDIVVDFDQRMIAGNARWQITNPQNEDSLHLDTDDLTIDSILVNGVQTGFQLAPPVPHLGSRLSIPVPEGEAMVAIYYHTGANPRALQWLEPLQTGGKTSPFLYTQSESIYARSWIPCPDGPGKRFTYTASVRVPKGLLALMSAENPQQVNDSSIYHFQMDIPIPAYLMALAVGDIRFQAIDERTGVYAEPYMLERAVDELAGVGDMVTQAEAMYGPYRWGRFDVLILPPGFPIGGMENPRLTFATPTIIAGDRSLVNLIAHELAHSWSGNLVTNATWNDFWLNEGFTVYFERRLTASMTDKSYADMLWELGYQDLVATVEMLGRDSQDTHLKLDLTGRDPDDGLTDIAYEKGALFLRLLEENVGRERFDLFLNRYFEAHAFKTIHTEAFLEYLHRHLLDEFDGLAQELDIDAWVYGPGIPANVPRADMERFSRVDQAREQFLSGKSLATLDTRAWTTHEWLHFLRRMPKPLSLPQMEQLDSAFHFTDSGNSEIADLWFVLSVAADYEPAYQAMEQFLSSVGRRKFLEPLYREMVTSGKAAMARTLYGQYRMNYHPLAQMSIDKIVNN